MINSMLFDRAVRLQTLREAGYVCQLDYHNCTRNATEIADCGEPRAACKNCGMVRRDRTSEGVRMAATRLRRVGMPVSSPPPVTPPPVTPPLVSGVAVPTGDIPHWQNIFWDDFTLDAAVGSFASATDFNKIVYTGAQGQKWRAYPENFFDTYQHRPYRSDVVLSVSNSCLRFDLHSVGGEPAGANPSPLIAGGASFGAYNDQYQIYGRYSARIKVDNANLSEYHAAWLLWPESGIWPTDGEEDFPEGSLSGTPGGFHHWARGPAGTNNGQDAATMPGGASWFGWHTYTIEWMPGRVIYYFDNTEVLNSTSFCPDGRRMRWQLQTETNGPSNLGHRGDLLCDWVSVWKWLG